MNVTVEDVMLVLVPFVGALAWLFRLEGRINTTAARYDEIIRRLDRMERAQDKARFA